MIDLENTISNLETNIRWIEDIPSHQFPGWGNVTMSMRDALELLKEQDDLGTELTNAMELIHKKNERIKKLEEQIETLTKWRMNAGAFD